MTAPNGGLSRLPARRWLPQCTPRFARDFEDPPRLGHPPSVLWCALLPPQGATPSAHQRCRCSQCPKSASGCSAWNPPATSNAVGHGPPASGSVFRPYLTAPLRFEKTPPASIDLLPTRSPTVRLARSAVWRLGRVGHESANGSEACFLFAHAAGGFLRNCPYHSHTSPWVPQFPPKPSRSPTATSCMMPTTSETGKPVADRRGLFR